MSNIRKFQLSDDIFWGYQVDINLNTVNSIKQIISIIKHDIISYLKPHNLEILIEKITDKKLYSIPFEDILLSNPKEIIYICNHPHDNCCIYESSDHKCPDPLDIYETKKTDC